VADEDLETQAEMPDEGATPLSEQFPALAGDPQREIEQRSADGADEGRFLKTFVVDREVGEDSPMHARNAVGVVQEAIQRGLHPKGDVYLVDRTVVQEKRSVSTELTYAVDVEPASVDHDPASTVTPSDLDETEADGDEPAAAKPKQPTKRRTAAKTTGK
jgi:hypothetical protein